MGIIESLKKLFGIKPKEEVKAPTPPPTPPTPTPSPTIPTAIKPSIDVINVKGIGPKRAERLKELGIHTVEELSKASAEELAKKLKVSPKITSKWVTEAKRLMEESS